MQGEDCELLHLRQELQGLQAQSKVEEAGGALSLDEENYKGQQRVLMDVHLHIPFPSVCNGTQWAQVSGSYHYFHYGHQHFDDRGWGCAYRSSQTIISWYVLNGGRSEKLKWAIGGELKIKDLAEVIPSIPELQQILVDCGDKRSSFVGSRQWIGTFEVYLLIDTIFDCPAKILHCPKGSKFSSDINPVLRGHFFKIGSPVMAGGEVGGALTVLGVGEPVQEDGGNKAALVLLLDPHYIGEDTIDK